MQTNIDWQLLTGSNIPFFPFMFILLPVTWLIVGFSNFSSKAIVPRWSIVVNPVILTIILSIVTWIIPKTECLLPGIFSLGITLYYIICWISLKKDRNLCLKSKSRKTKCDGREKRKAIFEAKTKCAQKSRLLPPSGQNTSVVQTPFESCLNDAFLLNFPLKYHLKPIANLTKNRIFI